MYVGDMGYMRFVFVGLAIGVSAAIIQPLYIYATREIYGNRIIKPIIETILILIPVSLFFAVLNVLFINNKDPLGVIVSTTTYGFIPTLFGVILMQKYYLRLTRRPSRTATPPLG